MIFCLYIFMIVEAQAKYFGGKYCEVSRDDAIQQCYEKETLVTMTHSPNQLAVDTSANTLYFSFDSGYGEYTAAVYKIESKDMTVLKGVNDAFAIAHNPNSSEIYFGGSNGIYKYNPIQKTLRRLNIKNLDVWWLFIKNYVYFIKFPSLYTYVYDGTISIVEELKDNVIHQFVIDGDDFKYFINNTGLYGIKKDNSTVLLKDTPRYVNMATDNHGLVHICSEDGIYVITNESDFKVKRILSVQGVLGFTFDKYNNLIYSNSHEIIKLVPVN